MRKSTHASDAPAYRVLLIDDNRNGLLARKAVLAEQGYSVSATTSPEEALQQFASEVFHLVVTDYRMPKMNGIQLIGELRVINPAVPILLVSGMVDVLGLNEKNTGADAVVAKNASEIQHMVRAAKRLLDRGTAKKPARRQGRKAANAKTA